ncbi:hypothetical protein [Streptomyces sp. NPDC085937]|uniref:hypothetical protein n=1 Tax=Streptomyces sp. NPDC085937 TaxID=3365742 RepID=UPI0037D79FB1
MSEYTPSQAEGEPDTAGAADEQDEQSGRRDVPRTTPSQAEGGDEEEEEEEDGDRE